MRTQSAATAAPPAMKMTGDGPFDASDVPPSTGGDGAGGDGAGDGGGLKADALAASATSLTVRLTPDGRLPLMRVVAAAVVVR